jgi:hypothetical protein
MTVSEGGHRESERSGGSGIDWERYRTVVATAHAKAWLGCW